MKPSVKLMCVVSADRADRDYAVAVSFTDRNGVEVSIAFDGRYFERHSGDKWHSYEYASWKESSAFNGPDRSGPGDDTRIIRKRRDALNKLDLD